MTKSTGTVVVVTPILKIHPERVETNQPPGFAIDDRLDRFHDVLARAWEAARAAEVGVSEATHANLIAAGIIAKPGN